MIIHLVDRLGQHYLCNQAVKPALQKSTIRHRDVTCKNCLKIIRSWEPPEPDIMGDFGNRQVSTGEAKP